MQRTIVRDTEVVTSLLLAAMLCQAKEYTAQVVRELPHDRAAFTQGLEIRDGTLYESTGMNGQSGLRRVDLATGQVKQAQALSANFFGEGITVLGSKIYQLTWQNQVGFVYDRATFKQLSSFTYQGEGWGLTNDGQRIYMSDGTADLRVIDPATMKEIRRIRVRDGMRDVPYLNELEWMKGEILANVWQTDRIARISPLDGKVFGWIDLTHLHPKEPGPDVLNGIAYDAKLSKLYVTGKWWPKMYEIRLVPKAAKP